MVRSDIFKRCEGSGILNMHVVDPFLPSKNVIELVMQTTGMMISPKIIICVLKSCVSGIEGTLLHRICHVFSISIGMVHGKRASEGPS